MQHTAFGGSGQLSSHSRPGKDWRVCFVATSNEHKDQASQFLLVKINIPWLFHPGEQNARDGYADTPLSSLPHARFKSSPGSGLSINPGRQERHSLIVAPAVCGVGEVLTCTPTHARQCLLNILSKHESGCFYIWFYSG